MEETEREPMKTFWINKYAALLVSLSLILMLSIGQASAASGSGIAVSKVEEIPDTTMKLQGGKEGTLFESLKIEGEDRIHIEFERPELILDLDPESAGGLEWQSVHAVLDHLGISLMDPFMNHSLGLRRQCFARPWLDQFAADGVARFQPNLKGVDKWRLMVANSKGEMVAAFEGNGKPPKEIVWDGISLEDQPVPPGHTYTYVLEAFDRAGNKKNFLGEGFELPSYRVDTSEGRMLLFSGNEVSESQGAGYGKVATPSAVLFDVANFINRENNVDAPVHIEVTARSFEEANRLAGDVVMLLKPYLLGNEIRVKTVTKVQSDAPQRGTVVVLLPQNY
jgi:hypothetical protein